MSKWNYFLVFFCLFKDYLQKIFLIFLPVLCSCFLPNLPKSLKGVLYTSSIAPFIFFGAIFSTCCPPWYIICCIRLCAISLSWPVACFIILGANASRPFIAWFTVSLPAYAKSYRFKNPPLWRFLRLLYCFFLILLVIFLLMSLCNKFRQLYSCLWLFHNFYIV